MAQLTEDLFVRGNVSSLTLTIPSSTVTNAMVSASAAIAHTKLQHQHRILFSQPNTTATAVTQVIFNVYGTTGTILSVKAGSIGVAVGDSSVSVDVKKNGTTVLSAPIVLDTGNTTYVGEAGTLSVTTLAASDTLTAVIAVTTGTGTVPTGVFVSVTVAEDAQ